MLDKRASHILYIEQNHNISYNKIDIFFPWKNFSFIIKSFYKIVGFFRSTFLIIRGHDFCVIFLIMIIKTFEWDQKTNFVRIKFVNVLTSCNNLGGRLSLSFTIWTNSESRSMTNVFELINFMRGSNIMF